MIAEIICVGTELLLGDIVNTNAAWIARELAGLGVSVFNHTVVGDNHKRLRDAYSRALERSDIVICTGGLGPTQDDMTKEALAEVSNRTLVRNVEAGEWLQNRFKERGYNFAPNNWRQADFPEDSIPLFNPFGTAPGCQLEFNNKIVFLLPGPPREMKPMFNSFVKPWIEERTDTILRSRILRIIGVGESTAEEMIKDIINGQSNPTIAPYAHLGELTFRITASAANEEKAYSLIEPIEQELRKRFEDNIYGVDDDTIEGVVVRLLQERSLTVACAESCTGGLVTAQLVNIPGVSTVLKEGIISYSNESKMKRLGVKEETLRTNGAVSAEVAAEMAVGIAKTSGADIGISTTGIAGPGGGTLEKPVGLVYLGLYFDGKVETLELRLFNQARDSIRKRTVKKLLDWVRRTIVKRQ